MRCLPGRRAESHCHLPALQRCRWCQCLTASACTQRRWATTTVSLLRELVVFVAAAVGGTAAALLLLLLSRVQGAKLQAAAHAAMPF